MKLILAYFLLIIVLVSSCTSSKTYATEAQRKAMLELLEKRQLRIESNWAYPQVTTAGEQCWRNKPYW